VCLPNDNYAEKQHSLDELQRLAGTAGIKTVGKMIQRRRKISSSQYLGTGFVGELQEKMNALGAELLIFDNPLSPGQGRNLQKNYGIDAIDRTEVILQVFHNHARTPESRLQVRLAELEYQLPRLKALWRHLDRQRGTTQNSGSGDGRGSQDGGGSLAQRGVGEKQIEIDRRLIEKEIQRIKKKLAKVDVQVAVTGKQRAGKKKACLVGYTMPGNRPFSINSPRLVSLCRTSCLRPWARPRGPSIWEKGKTSSSQTPSGSSPICLITWSLPSVRH